ncbi:hypothetical protein ACIQF5_11345 [Streptomyces goshikiensis]|uniref:hypothetical protein n=1 Tax=Streptomyces goshikiensis TaxID=1942 RepID=UPI0038247CD7
MALAECRRPELWNAMKKGKPFDVNSGLPESEVRKATANENVRPDPTWWHFNYRLSSKLGDTPAAGETFKRRRRGFNTAMEYAIETGYLDVNPLAGVKRAGPKGGDAVDLRVLDNGVQGSQLLTTVTYVGSVHCNRGRRLVAFFGCQPTRRCGLRKLLEGLAGGAGIRPASRQGRLPARAAAVRPTAHLHQELAECRGPGRRGCLPRRQLAGGHSLAV